MHSYWRPDWSSLTIGETLLHFLCIESHSDQITNPPRHAELRLYHQALVPQPLYDRLRHLNFKVEGGSDGTPRRLHQFLILTIIILVSVSRTRRIFTSKMQRQQISSEPDRG